MAARKSVHLLAFVAGLAQADITVSAGNLVSATVLGKVGTGFTLASVASAGNTGDGVLSAVSASSGAARGDYVLVCLDPAANGGAFAVITPKGINIGSAYVGVAFDSEIDFTINDGATDFVAGDRFVITVSEGDYSYVALDPAATDGSQVASAILYGDADASTEAVPALAHTSLTTVMESKLVWPDAITASEKSLAIAQLANNNIIVR